MSIDQYYEFGSYDEIILVDEYDSLIDDKAYAVYNSTLNGIWQLKDKHVIAFTATSSLAYERLVNNCISKPLTLKFKSEFELINGVTPT